MSNAHCPVLLQEVLEGVAVKPEGRYIDMTFGRGGHTSALLERLSAAGEMLVIDKDPSAINVATALANALEKETGKPRLHVRHGSFAKLATFVDDLGWRGKVDGVMMDLGVSSPQLNEAARGFSFMRDGPLDMRMDTSCGQTAAQWIATTEKEEIARVLWLYGEERQSRKIASAIVMDREKKPFTTTLELASLIERICPRGRNTKKHPATKSFQAIRIAINHELDDLSKALEDAVDVLSLGGRLAVISFHSLEDRMVKQFIRQLAEGKSDLPRGLPIKDVAIHRVLKTLGGAIKPTYKEVEDNSRSRSARLRIAEKINESNT
jgi:16S rRNA (cytosine1402-N4)-methyltransferase